MEIQLIVGLGNPGTEYARTRHNAGFWWVDAIAEAKRASWKKETKFSGWSSRVEEGGREYALLKPATFMNVSGKSVGAFLRFYKLEPGAMLVVHDELDLQPGAVKLKMGGGTGGHNGLEDIVEVLGTKDFWRLRIGIGHPGVKSEVINYVLKKPSPEHRVEIEKSIEQALSGIDLVLDGDMERAAMKINARPPRPKPEKPAKPDADDPPEEAVPVAKASKP